ncbi:Cof-type HAD-IIB family hydrolase [Vaginisenegalia massiliensis]|uniref:Cof-type HAD-IIB family hydrolase n=1 Tax=Vaginisenegalia massiliensis TaxID=2058294 RepID=UPI000F53CC39|nr:Cof-type HAD-IIB family hydrolase [Vaginisenegalia massiliensis]
MKQHLIAIDLDGTTLNNQSKVSPLTIQTLQTLDQMGHLVCIVTGRPYRNSEAIYRQLNIQAPMVNFNGALCHFPGNDQWIPSYHVCLDKEMAFELFSHQEQLEINLLCAEGRDQLFTTSMALPDSPFYPVDRSHVYRLSRESLTYDPTALTIFSHESKQKEIEQNILTVYGDQVSVRTWGGQLPCLEVVRKGINKAIGVKAIAEFYRIPQEAILAFGDEENDLEMLTYAGLGVAMKNANPELVKVSQDQTDFTNDEDGLARYLIQYFGLTN